MKHIPLSNTFFLVSILGLIISVFLALNGVLSDTWAFLFILMFIIFVIAAFVSATPDDEDNKKIK